MKALPLITLAICITFLGIQQMALSSRSKTVTTLQTRIAEVKSAAPTRRAGDRGPASNTPASRAGRSSTGSGGSESLADLDLEALAQTAMGRQLGGIPDLKAMMRMQSLLLEATPEELQDLIARTAELEVPDQVKQGLLGEFVRALSEHDPKAALQLAFQSEHLDLDRQRWRFRESFSKWSKEDPDAAITWFDQQLATGAFETKSLDGESRAELEFQRVAVATLLDSDPSAARQRLLALPEEKRLEILAHGNPLRITEENALAHAQLVRDTLPEDQQPRALADASRDLLHRMDYEGLAEHTTRINATQPERTAILEAAVARKFERFGWEEQTPTADDVTEAQRFLQTQVPEEAGRITGEALAQFGSTNENSTAAAALITEIHAASPNDDLVVGFLLGSGHGRLDPTTGRTLAEQISDPARRQEIFKQLK